jgi:hypothetical protein
MAWTAPRTWNVGELVTASMMNTHVRDNLSALKTPPSSYVDINTTDFTTSSTSFTALTGYTVTVDGAGGDMLCTCTMTWNHSSATGRIYFNLYLDGVAQVADDGIASFYLGGMTNSGSAFLTYTLVWHVKVPAAGSHTYAVYVKTSGATLTVYGGAGTVGADVHSRFNVTEIG